MGLRTRRLLSAKVRSILLITTLGNRPPYNFFTLKVVGILLAGGKSKRFGSDKRFAVYGGKTFIERCLETLTRCFDEVYISAERGFKYDNFPIIEDYENHMGPLFAIMGVMERVKSEGFVFTTVDMPFVSDKTLKFLKDCLESYPLVCLDVDGNLSFPIGIRGECLFRLKGWVLNGEKSLFKILQGEGVKAIKVNKNLEFMNINTPEDLRAIL